MSSNLIYVNVIAIVFALFFMDYGLGQQNGASVSIAFYYLLLLFLLFLCNGESTNRFFSNFACIF